MTSRNVAQFVNNICLSALNHKLLCSKLVSVLLHDFSPWGLPLKPGYLVLELCPISPTEQGEPHVKWLGQRVGMHGTPPPVIIFGKKSVSCSVFSLASPKFCPLALDCFFQLWYQKSFSKLPSQRTESLRTTSQVIEPGGSLQVGREVLWALVPALIWIQCDSSKGSYLFLGNKCLCWKRRAFWALSRE